ncbi:hypothetical protein Phou_016210 [Phytohabitans houttuyneae]|uniref:Uncharacterized protein n=1 Tax=Phytohabitans houttuyneae TaxID=1076126 RepID=A0A6V8K4X1_9ACTN|nr:hypothetical protein Phou_016210 [Phytohabitans houttuyneae]
MLSGAGDEAAAAGGSGTGAAGSSTMQDAPGQAPEAAAATGFVGMVPGTQITIDRCRPAHRYSIATCGVPKIRRRHQTGRRISARVAHHTAAPSTATSGGGVMVT